MPLGGFPRKHRQRQSCDEKRAARKERLDLKMRIFYFTVSLNGSTDCKVTHSYKMK